MLFSKSFGYALRGVLYIAMSEGKEKVQLDEIAAELSVPRHFLGKVMKRMVKEGILQSMKGPYGGFSIHEHTLQTPLMKLIEITGESDQFSSCVLRLRNCDASNPCPLHHQFEVIKKQWYAVLANTTIGDLLKRDKQDFIRSIAVI